MNKILYFLFFTLTILSCSKDKLENQNDFDKSNNAFQKFKNDHNNMYSYKTSRHLHSVGIGEEYTFEIIKGVVTKRSFMYTYIGGIQRPETGWTEELARRAFQASGYTNEAIENLISKLEWSENKEELGTKEPPHNIWTLDQIYDKAKEEWLIKRPNSKIYFEANNNGLISLAGYIPNECQDDCFIGIQITKIEKLKD